MPDYDRNVVSRNLRAWICKVNPAAAAMKFGDDTDLIESRILESLQVVEFILFLERETGREILVERLDPASLRTLNSVYQNFFESCS
jgi:acyl carrier protein